MAHKHRWSVVDVAMLAGVVDFEVCHPVCAGVFHFLCWVSTPPKVYRQLENLCDMVPTVATLLLLQLFYLSLPANNISGTLPGSWGDFQVSHSPMITNLVSS